MSQPAVNPLEPTSKAEPEVSTLPPSAEQSITTVAQHNAPANDAAAAPAPVPEAEPAPVANAGANADATHSAVTEHHVESNGPSASADPKVVNGVESNEPSPSADPKFVDGPTSSIPVKADETNSGLHQDAATNGAAAKVTTTEPVDGPQSVAAPAVPNGSTGQSKPEENTAEKEERNARRKSSMQTAKDLAVKFVPRGPHTRPSASRGHRGKGGGCIII